ncbi:MAG: ATP-binding protein [Deltaproteobacteria bacterium]|jgi:hypothetical protein|nr:ATP-binding protein [Deltaproteobacteria bacterium]
MSQNAPVLPVSIQSFEKLRLKNAVYVDKTQYFPMLPNTSDVIFCSRPRRFGKTLTVRALDAYFSGEAKLFKGLAAEASMDSPDFVPHPVISLNMSSAADSDNKEIFTENLLECLNVNAERHNLSLRYSDPGNAFSSLIKDTWKANGKKVVLLIDEYDAPVISLVQRDKHIYDEILLSQTRGVMLRFYTQIKFSDQYLEFVFITGVTKFSRLGLFSQLNTLVDISLMPQYAAFMGYTQDELTDNFGDFITKSAKKFKINESELLLKLRDYYNGFSFDGDTKLYNPFSINYFFLNNKFSNYWFQSGSEKIIKKFLLEKALTVDQFQDFEVDAHFAENPGEIDTASPAGFLYQAGYLTLRSKGDGQYALDYPNLEIRQSLSSLFLQNFNDSPENVAKAGRELVRHLATRDIPEIVNVFSKLLSGICYDDHVAAGRAAQDGSLDTVVRRAIGIDFPIDAVRRLSAALAEKIIKEQGESFYRSILHAGLWTAGAEVTPEKHENIGRLDLEAVFGGITYVFELKMAEDVIGGPEAARAGMAQIRDRGCGHASDRPVLVSLAIGRKERNIVSCIFEMDGQETCVLPERYWKYLEVHRKSSL